VIQQVRLDGGWTGGLARRGSGLFCLPERWVGC